MMISLVLNLFRKGLLATGFSVGHFISVFSALVPSQNFPCEPFAVTGRRRNNLEILWILCIHDVFSAAVTLHDHAQNPQRYGDYDASPI